MIIAVLCMFPKMHSRNRERPCAGTRQRITHSSLATIMHIHSFHCGSTHGVRLLVSLDAPKVGACAALARPHALSPRLISAPYHPGPCTRHSLRRAAQHCDCVAHARFKRLARPLQAAPQQRKISSRCWQRSAVRSPSVSYGLLRAN
jgi:hypothetical protein